MDYQALMPLTLAIGKATLAAGTTTTISNTGTTVYAIRGKAYSKGAMTNAATPTIDGSTGLAFNPVAANFGSVYMVGFNAAGTVIVLQGTIVPLLGTGLFQQAPQFGTVPNDFCPIGYVLIKAGSTASSAPGWRFGTDNLSGTTGITYTFVDVIGMPDRPQIA